MTFYRVTLLAEVLVALYGLAINAPWWMVGYMGVEAAKDVLTLREGPALSGGDRGD